MPESPQPQQSDSESSRRLKPFEAMKAVVAKGVEKGRALTEKGKEWVSGLRIRAPVAPREVLEAEAQASALEPEFVEHADASPKRIDDAGEIDVDVTMPQLIHEQTPVTSVQTPAGLRIEDGEITTNSDSEPVNFDTLKIAVKGYEDILPTFQEGEDKKLFLERIKIILHECLRNDPQAGDRRVLDYFESCQVLVPEDGEYRQLVAQLTQRFLDIRLGSVEDHRANGARLIREVREMIISDPLLAERLEKNLTAAQKVIAGLKPVHCCLKKPFEGIMRKGQMYPAHEGLKAGITNKSNSFYYDAMMGLDHTSFFSYNKPFSSYGENVVVLRTESMQAENCCVTMRDFNKGLEHPNTLEGMEATTKYGNKSLYIDRYTFDCDDPEKVKQLLDAYYAEAEFYKQGVITGNDYQEIMTLLVAASFDRVDMANYLSVTVGGTHIPSHPQNEAERRVQSMLRSWSDAEIKYRGVVSEENIAFGMTQNALGAQQLTEAPVNVIVYSKQRDEELNTFISRLSSEIASSS